MLKEGLTDSIFNISTYSMVLYSFLLHLMEISPKAHNFLNKTISKPCSFAVNYFETTINTKFSTVKHYLTNSNTKNWLWKEGIISFCVIPNFFKFFSSIKKWGRLTHFSIKSWLYTYNSLLKKWVNRWHFLHF